MSRRQLSSIVVFRVAKARPGTAGSGQGSGRATGEADRNTKSTAPSPHGCVAEVSLLQNISRNGGDPPVFNEDYYRSRRLRQMRRKIRCPDTA